MKKPWYERESVYWIMSLLFWIGAFIFCVVLLPIIFVLIVAAGIVVQIEEGRKKPRI